MTQFKLRRLVVLSDEHKAYPQAIRRLRREVEHLVTSSRERRYRARPDTILTAHPTE